MIKENKCVIAEIHTEAAYVGIQNNIIDLDNNLFITAYAGVLPNGVTRLLMSCKSAKGNFHDNRKYLNDLDYFVDILTAESIADDVDYEIRNFTDSEIDLIYSIFNL